MQKASLIGAGLVSLMLAGTALAAPDGKRAGLDRSAPVARAYMLAMANTRFDRIDANQDGMIEAAEMTAHREQMREKMRERRAERRAQRMAAQAEAGADAATDDADSAGDAARWQERRAQRMAAMAKRGDGQPGQRGQWLARMDTDGDGMISRDEFAARAMKRFDRADADSDGIVTPEERAAMREARRARRG